MNPHVLLPLLALYGCDHNIQFPGPDDVAQDTGEGVGPSPSTETLPPDMDRDGWNVEEDCDDFDPEVHPGAKEVVADGVDQDCDGGDTCHEDLDGDGYGTTETVASDNPDCVDPGESQVSSDCDDTD
ncbi:MAG: putative metal-binding motif-containing protein, partial [Deltaproteobacteria bacterium]|nr:putative metal-binding motif-containing protein [Deltaproteobacteria bacterium]